MTSTILQLAIAPCTYIHSKVQFQVLCVPLEINSLYFMAPTCHIHKKNPYMPLNGKQGMSLNFDGIQENFLFIYLRLNLVVVHPLLYPWYVNLLHGSANFFVQSTKGTTCSREGLFSLNYIWMTSLASRWASRHNVHHGERG